MQILFGKEWIYSILDVWFRTVVVMMIEQTTFTVLRFKRPTNSNNEKINIWRKKFRLQISLKITLIWGMLFLLKSWGFREFDNALDVSSSQQTTWKWIRSCSIQMSSHLLCHQFFLFNTAKYKKSCYSLKWKHYTSFASNTSYYTSFASNTSYCTAW